MRVKRLLAGTIRHICNNHSLVSLITCTVLIVLVCSASTDISGGLSPGEIAMLRETHMRWVPLLQSSFTLNVSYNGCSSVTEPGDHDQIGFCSRLLFRFV
jgi:hypothetical protein